MLILLLFRTYQRKVYVIRTLPDPTETVYMFAGLAEIVTKTTSNHSSTGQLLHSQYSILHSTHLFNLHNFCFYLCLGTFSLKIPGICPFVQNVSINFLGWLAAFLPACLCDGLDPEQGHTLSPFQVISFYSATPATHNLFEIILG